MDDLNDVSHALVTQDEALTYHDRGYVFIKGRGTRVKNKDDIRHFQSSRLFRVKLMKVVRKKATAPNAAEPKVAKPKAKPKATAKNTKKKGFWVGKNKSKKQ